MNARNNSRYYWTAHSAVATAFRVKQDFGHRPPRLGRLFDTSPLYFVTFCTHLRKPFLARDEVHAAFVVYSQRAQRELSVAVGRYVIMPDHVHLFVRGSPVFRLGPWVGLLKQALAKAARLSRAKTQLWEEGFFDHILRSNESYSQKWNYVRENPVRARLVKSGEDWPYQGEIVYIDRA
jgi:REP element-mobilizing transposase RayT